MRTPLRWIRRAWARRPVWPRGRHHFDRDYRRLVRRLLADHPRDEAMSLAVGGDYDALGPRLVEALVLHAGLSDGMALIDLGCGSGRLATALGRSVAVDYLGLDVVPELLAYARTRAPAGYRFALNRGYTLPAESESVDLVCAFSVFTHLRHEESFLYMREAMRGLRPGGALVLTFLEFDDPGHWATFMRSVDAALHARGPIDVFIEASVVRLWGERLGFGVPDFRREIGQTLAVLRKPAAPASDDSEFMTQGPV